MGKIIDRVRGRQDRIRFRNQAVALVGQGLSAHDAYSCLLAVQQLAQLGWPLDNDTIDAPISEANLSERTKNALLSEGITTVGQAQAMTDRALLNLPLIGKKSLGELRSLK